VVLLNQKKDVRNDKNDKNDEDILHLVVQAKDYDYYSVMYKLSF
jgi:hypothetical protein